MGSIIFAACNGSSDASCGQTPCVASTPGTLKSVSEETILPPALMILGFRFEDGSHYYVGRSSVAAFKFRSQRCDICDQAAFTPEWRRVRSFLRAQFGLPGLETKLNVLAAWHILVHLSPTKACKVSTSLHDGRPHQLRLKLAEPELPKTSWPPILAKRMPGHYSELANCCVQISHAYARPSPETADGKALASSRPCLTECCAMQPRPQRQNKMGVLSAFACCSC